MKVGDLVTCISWDYYYCDQGYFLIVEERCLGATGDIAHKDFKLRRISDGYKTRWLPDNIWKKL